MPTFPSAILTCKVGQTDIVFGAWSGFISGCVHARLQVSMSCGHNLCDTD